MEQKMYVTEMPKSCYVCPCFDTNEAMCSITGTYTKFKQGKILKNCPLKLLDDYKKELVAIVCERIKEQLGFIVNGQERTICDGSMTGDKTILAVLDQIQKEFEDE